MVDFRKNSGIVMAEVKAVLDAVENAQVERFVDKVTTASRVFATGEGRSGYVAKAFAMRLCHLGFDVHVVGEATTPSISPGDLLVAVSGSGETPVTLHIAKAANTAGAQIAVVVCDADTSLARLADAVLVIPGKTKHGKGKPSAQMPGTLFEQCAWLALDSIVLDLMALRGESHDGMRRRHANLE